MISWIAKKLSKTENSPFSEQGIKELLEFVAPLQPESALDAIGERVESAVELDLDTAVRQRIVKRLDEAAQSSLHKVYDGIFGDNLGESIADAKWRALVGYQRNIYDAYVFCLEQLPPPDKIDAAQRQDALLMATRAMVSLVAHMALMRIRYRDPHPTVWTDSRALHAVALKYDVADKPVKVYPADVEQTTMEREYLTGLMLDVAPTGNLLPTQTHCLHLILRSFSEHYRSGDNYDPKMPFVIDPAKGKPPQRALPGIKPRPGMRFFGFGDVRSHLDSMRQNAYASDHPPGSVRQSRIDIDRYRALLDMLMEHWSDSPPQRRSRRDQQAATIVVTRGLAQVYRMLAYSKYAKEGKLNYAESPLYDSMVFGRKHFGKVNDDKSEETTDQALTPIEILEKFELAGDREITERWSLVDRSECGLGAIAEQHRGWLRAGMLVGFRYENSVEWHVATVRRVARTPLGKLSVGLECPKEKVSCARVRVNDTDPNDIWTAPGAGEDPFTDAILVGGDQPTLILASGIYSPNRECLMRVGVGKQDIRFGRLIERGVHFERISILTMGEPHDHDSVALPPAMRPNTAPDMRPALGG